MSRPRPSDPTCDTLLPHRLHRLLKRPAVAMIVLLGSGLLGGCGSNPEGYNDADVTYATDVTSHHAQTLQVLDLSLGRQSLDPELGALADETRQQLFAEVDVTQKWLRTNDRPIPKTALQHTHDDTQSYDTSIPGMLSSDQMHKLEKSRNRNFQAAWLHALITHEEGAVELAQAAVDEAQNAELTKTAEADLEYHEGQLAKLEDLAGA